nr:PKD domain-containing protein [uncultured Brumimicrobium sp.]
MKNLLLLIFSLLLLSSINTSFAGGGGSSYINPPPGLPDCSNQPAPGNTGCTATPICEVNGYCGTTSSSYSADYWTQLNSAFCGSIENNAFLSFTAQSTSISFDAYVYNCNSDEAIQIFVFQADNCASGAVTDLGCTNSMYAQNTPYSISATGLTPGEEYYIMIDGFAGDVCDYTFVASSGVVMPVSVTPDTFALCVGETVDLTADGGDGVYNWDPSPDLSATTGATVTVTAPATAGVYTYTVHSDANSNCLGATSATATITVDDCGCPITTSNSGSVCEGDPFSLTANLASGNMTSYSWSGPFGFSSTDQNPTGIPAPPAGTHDYTFTATIDGVLCTSTTTLTVNDCSGGCDVDAIRTAFTNAGCIELDACVSDCSMYFLNPQSMSGSAAQAFAEGLGANLVSVQSQTENDCLLGALSAIGETGTIWIGLNDEAVEGTFEWYDQSPVTYTNWAPGEPNQSGNEDCVQIYPGGTYPGMWNDLDCGSNNSKSIIEVNMCPVVDAGPDLIICEGETATMNSSPTVLGSAPYTYAWNHNGPTNYPNSVSPNVTTEYVLRTEDRYACVGTDTMVVTVNPLPDVDAGPDQVICEGESVILNVPGGTGTWNNGVTNGVAFTPTTTQTYTYTATENGCTSSSDLTVQVNPMPTADAGLDQVICEGESVTLIGNGTGTWDNGVTNGVAFTPNATQDYTYTVTENGCTVTDVVTVTVNPLPVVDAGADQTICEGEFVSLNGTGGSGTWDNGVSNGVSFGPTTTQNYTYTVTTNGCTSSDEVTVFVNPNPDVGIVPSDVIGCDTLTVDFESQFNQPGATYSIDFGDGTNANFTDNVAHHYDQSGCFDVTVTATLNGCVATTSYPDLVCVTALPEADFLPEPPLLSILDTETTFLNNSSNATDYQWDFGDGSAFSNEYAPTHTYPNEGAGSYVVTLIASSGVNCNDTARVVVEVEDQLIYYIPNTFTPDNDDFNETFNPIFTAGFDIYDYTLYIYNRWGELIFESHNSEHGWDGTYGESSEKLVEGTYVWKIDFKTTMSDERKTIVGHVNLLR